jgi:hypothetical protein
LVTLEWDRFVTVSVFDKNAMLLYILYTEWFAGQRREKGCIRWEFLNVFQKRVPTRAKGHI